MAVRDTGWIQIFVENGQEAVDKSLRLPMGEDQDVLLPVMVHIDVFICLIWLSL
jgi:pyruvate ferredoxin oxidoreductase alpha subunit